MSALIILVNIDSRTLRLAEGILSDEGYLVAALSSFEDAKKLLETLTPDLLITDLGPDIHEGLNLAIRSHVDHGDVPVIVTHTTDDRRADAAAKRCGAEFIVNPLENPRFLPCVRSAIEQRRRQQRPIRRWLRDSVPRVVEVDAGAVRARVIDLSYGGVRLAFAQPVDVPPLFNITLPAQGATVEAHRVWMTRRDDDEYVYCGAELAESGSDTWRRFVDSVRDA